MWCAYLKSMQFCEIPNLTNFGLDVTAFGVTGLSMQHDNIQHPPYLALVTWEVYQLFFFWQIIFSWNIILKINKYLLHLICLSLGLSTCKDVVMSSMPFHMRGAMFTDYNGINWNALRLYHDASAIIFIFRNYHYFYALGHVIIMIFRDKVLMDYWQLILFAVASSCTSALYL